VPLLPILLVAAALATAAPAAPTPTRPARSYTLEHALTLRSYSDLTWSADGRRLAFVVSEPDTAESAVNADVYVADFDRGDVVRLTRHPKGDTSPTFSPSGDTVAFVATRGTGEDAKPAIYMLSLRGGEPWPFGTYDEAVGEVRWSPDGLWLAYVKTDTLPKRVRDWQKKKWDQVIEDERLQYPHLWVVEVATGKSRRLVGGENYVWHVRWSPDSRSIAFLASPTGKPDDARLADVGIVAVDGGPMRKLGAIGERFAWSPDGAWIAWAAGTHRQVEVEKADVWVCAAAGGTPVNLTAGFDEDGHAPAWNATSDTLFFHAWRGASTVLAAVPRAGGPVRLMVDREGDAGAPLTSAGGRAAWVVSHSDAPDEIVVADHPALPGRAVTSLNAAVASLVLAPARVVRWTSTDGVTVEGVLLRPAGAPERAPLKTLVALHGGPYASRYDLGFESVPQFLAAHGYQVFMPNFRASGGYGTAFMLRERADWGGQDWRDVASGVDSLARWGLADGNRLGVYGGSYGGYLTAWAITQTGRFDAACVQRGIVDLASLWGQSDSHRYRAFEFDGHPWETAELWERSSPISYIANARTPTLIVVGEADRRTPLPQMQELYQSLLALDVPTQFVRYPREGHGSREPRHRADELVRMLAWFDRWIR